MEFSFKVRGPAETTRQQGFAFWYVYNDVAKSDLDSVFEHHGDDSILETLEHEHYELMGYKGKFDGFGVIFNNVKSDEATSTNRYSPTISLIKNDGTRTLSVKDGVTMPYDFRNKGILKVRLRLQPSKVSLFVQHAPLEEEGEDEEPAMEEYIQVALFDDVDVKHGAFVGWSAVSGHESSEEGDADAIEIGGFSVDDKEIREDLPDVPEVTPDDHEVPDEEDAHEPIPKQDQKAGHSEAEVIQKLTNTVLKLVFETEPLRDEMHEALETLTRRVTGLEETLTALKHEINEKTGHDLDKEFAEVSKELSSLSRYAKAGGDSRQRNLDDIHASLVDEMGSGRRGILEKMERHLDKATSANKSVMKQLEQGHKWTVMMLFSAILCISIAGFMLYNKFLAWEKKHIL